jgi:hypothetical protein
MTIFYCLIFETPLTWRARYPVFISSRNSVVQLYPQALGVLYVGSFDSQGYDGNLAPMSMPYFMAIVAQIKVLSE